MIHCMCRGLNQWPPVLKSHIILTGLCGSADCSQQCCGDKKMLVASISFFSHSNNVSTFSYITLKCCLQMLLIWTFITKFSDKVLTFSLTSPAFLFTCLQYKSIENTVGKGELLMTNKFLLFPVFSTFIENFLPYLIKFKTSSANTFSLEE